MKTNSVLLAFGSNIGDKKASISSAICLLNAFFCRPLDVSHLYESEPVGCSDQPWFLNCCASGQTAFSPLQMLFFCKSAEYFLGRKQRNRWREREIDIDIIFFNNTIMNSKFLTLPHSQFHLRKFVLMPAAELLPEFIPLPFENNLSQILEICPDNSIVRRTELKI